MFRVLLGKLTEYDISFEELSKAVGMSVKVLKQCIKTGDRKLRLDEAVAIRNYVAPNMTLDELYKPVTEIKKDCAENCETV